MSEFYTYITKENDRWDLISYNFYNDPTKYQTIINANLEIPITPILDAGLKLKIPVLKDTDAIKFELPPWKS